MSELYAIARNIRFFYVDDEGLVPEIEAVLTVSEFRREFVGPVAQNVKHLETIRICMGPEAARQLAKDLNSWAAEAEQVKAEYVIEKEPAQSGEGE